jgi:hypothetical protein
MLRTVGALKEDESQLCLKYCKKNVKSMEKNSKKVKISKNCENNDL